MQSVPITTDVVSSNLDQDEVYNIMNRTEQNFYWCEIHIHFFVQRIVTKTTH